MEFLNDEVVHFTLRKNINFFSLNSNKKAKTYPTLQDVFSDIY